MNQEDRWSQGRSGFQRNPQAARELGPEALAGVIPNPKGKILDQVRNAMRLKQFSV
jgi:hypothetical protein